ncbi:lysozyme inhibitor LprI family protein [Cupriavidus sp.]|uniref:ATP-dependent Clp protease proteolytic subunit n=1 Tax=Cupriavidus sp. TaxID=1873897 RepID=UPI0025C32CB9|nr:lysozyme inhibitor LprI family protein [Cupriavidus sp.]
MLPALLLALGGLFPGSAPAMEFRIYHQPELNRRMVIGEGRIEDGDAGKFQAVARIADRDDEGLVALILNSPGGNVEAAFRLVDAMDKVRVYTIVPDSARCASACASVVFASGERRSVLGSGLLGFHSCYKRQGAALLSDSLCNEIVAANAMQRGVTHAAINRFVTDYDAHDMAWVGRNVVCRSLQGLCKPGRMENRNDSHAALRRSLDCSRLASMASQLVCGDTELARTDKELADLYGRKFASAANRTRIRDDQRAWLRDERNRCSDKACLLRAYRSRIDALKRT